MSISDQFSDFTPDDDEDEKDDDEDACHVPVTFFHRLCLSLSNVTGCMYSEGDDLDLENSPYNWKVSRVWDFVL